MHDGNWGRAASRGGRKWECGTTTVQSERRNCESSFQHVAAVVQLQLQLQLQQSERVSGAAPAPWSGVWQRAVEERGFDFCQRGFPPVHSAAVCSAPELSLNRQTLDSQHMDGLMDGWVDCLMLDGWLMVGLMVS